MGQSPSTFALGNNALGQENVSDRDKLELLCRAPNFNETLESEHVKALRPERPEYAKQFRNGAPNPRWESTMSKMLDTVTRGGRSSLLSYLEPLGFRCQYRSTWPCPYYHYYPMEESRIGLVFQAIAIILYDQECAGLSDEEGLATLTRACRMDLATRGCQKTTGSSATNNASINDTTPPLRVVPAPESRRVEAAFKFLIQYLLCYDYLPGTTLPCRLPADEADEFYAVTWPDFDDFCSLLMAVVICFKQGRAPDRRAWTNLFLGLMWLQAPVRDNDVTDVVLAVYYYATHLYDEDSTREYYEDGEVDDRDLFPARRVDPRYRPGILRDMCLEIPTRGPDRLLRKLSTDVHVHSEWISDEGVKEKVRAAAQAIAVEHGLADGEGGKMMAEGKRLQDIETEPTYAQIPPSGANSKPRKEEGTKSEKEGLLSYTTGEDSESEGCDCL